MEVKQKHTNDYPEAASTTNRTARMETIISSVRTDLATGNNCAERAKMTLPITKDEFYELMALVCNQILARRGKPKNFVIDEFVVPIMDAIYSYTQKDKPRGLAVVGGYGRGKSLLMEGYVCLHNTLVNNSEGYLRRPLFVYTSAPRLFRELSANCNMDYKSPMVIDELGREPLGGKVYGMESSPVVDLLFERYHVGSITHITSNCDAELLGSIYGPMLHSRMLEMFEFIEMKGFDRRKVK